MSTYRVKELFGPTIQGEGVHAGRVCVFLRFAACNLACTWCDTDFSPDGAARLTAADIADALSRLDATGSRTVVVTGGEPALQWDAPLADALRAAGFRVHMETNGTRALAAPVDWLTVSPKPQFHPPGVTLAELEADECKVVVDDAVDDETLADYERRYACAHYLVQPCWGPGYDASLARAIALARKRPRWRLGVQLHKWIGLP
ncbi:MAG: radical SAM protein [Deltaproteobacteria bacterium]|nr:MAG: radical SAM protein [Deltaproteobacteria bacterium]